MSVKELKTELRSFRARVRKIKSYEQERETIIARQYRLLTPDGQRGSGNRNNDPVQRAVQALARMDMLIAENIVAEEEERRKIEHAIERLSPEESELIHRYYVMGQSWEQVAVEAGYSIGHIWRRHGEILQKMEKMRDNER